MFDIFSDDYSRHIDQKVYRKPDNAPVKKEARSDYKDSKAAQKDFIKAILPVSGSSSISSISSISSASSAISMSSVSSESSSSSESSESEES